MIGQRLYPFNTHKAVFLSLASVVSVATGLINMEGCVFKYCDGPQGKQAVQHCRKHKLLERGKKTPASNRRHHNQVLVALGFCTERSVRDISHLTGHVCEGKKGVLILMHSNHLGKTYGSILTESCLEGS